MYEDFYGLKEKPFSLTPDPRFLYLSESHRFALDHLIYGITQREGFMLITGDVGTGKTTICRTLLERLDEQTKTALILNPQMSETELLLSILSEFGITFSSNSKKEIIDRLNQFLLDQLAFGGGAVLIIDEAQNLSLPVLEQIRLLSNLETEKEKLLQIILVGQPELRDKLNLPVLRQLNQRISVRYHLRPLKKNEIKKYIDHRLMVAGSPGNIVFSRRALSLIFKYSGGVPRLVNLLADRAMLGAFSKQSWAITPGLVKTAAGSLGDEKVLPGKRHPLVSAKWYGYGVAALVIVTLLFIAVRKGINLRPSHHISSSKPNVSDVPQPPNSTKTGKISVPIPKNDIVRPPTVENTPAKISRTSGKKDFYTIHLESYPNEESAISAAKRFTRLGYQIYIARVELPAKGTRYRLLLGRFKDKQTSRKVMEGLRRKGELKEFPDAVIRKASVAFGNSG